MGVLGKGPHAPPPPRGKPGHKGPMQCLRESEREKAGGSIFMQEREGGRQVQRSNNNTQAQWRQCMYMMIYAECVCSLHTGRLQCLRHHTGRMRSRPLVALPATSCRMRARPRVQRLPGPRGEGGSAWRPVGPVGGHLQGLSASAVQLESLSAPCAGLYIHCTCMYLNARPGHAEEGEREGEAAAGRQAGEGVELEVHPLWAEQQ